MSERGIFSLTIFSFAAVLLWDTIGMRTDTVLVPRIVGVLLLLFSFLQLIVDWFPSLQRVFSFTKSAEASQTIGGEGVVNENEKIDERNRRFGFIGWMMIFATLIYFTNVIIAIFIAMFLYLRWISKESWKMSILYPGITAMIVYLAFVVGLEVHYFL